MDMLEERQVTDYETYEDYLDSFIQPQDLFYLRDPHFARMLAALGYRSAIDVLTRQQFEMKKESSDDESHSRRSHILFSANCHPKELFLVELAARERPNRLGMVTTIIFMRHHQSNGTEISGFIDYEESLRKSVLDFENGGASGGASGGADWTEIFKETKKIFPKKDDLGFYNWRTGYSVLNDSRNFKAITDPNRGLIFECRHDRQQLFINALCDVGNSSVRTVIKSINYDHVVLYDHVVKKKI